jgi:phage gpG-like protein
MTDAYNIKLTPEAEDLVKRLGTPDYILRGIRTSLDVQNNLTLDHIREKRLTGKGPYPVDQHRLGERTKQYRKSARTAKAVISGTNVAGGLGANVIYAGIHESGGEIKRTVKPGKVRLRTDRDGFLLRQKSNKRLVVFARSHHKHFIERGYVGGRKYTIKIPARAPMTTGVKDRLEETGKGVSQGIVDAWKGQQS